MELATETYYYFISVQFTSSGLNLIRVQSLSQRIYLYMANVDVSYTSNKC